MSIRIQLNPSSLYKPLPPDISVSVLARMQTLVLVILTLTIVSQIGPELAFSSLRMRPRLFTGALVVYVLWKRNINWALNFFYKD
jgi:hypothetical protein